MTSRGAIDARLVREARREKVELMRRKGVYEYTKLEDCVRHTGKNPISVQWVDVHKGTVEEPNMRCRLVARDFKAGTAEDCFCASMLPPEAKKMLFAQTAEKYGRWRRGQEEDYCRDMFIDGGLVEAECDREHAHVVVPPESAKGGFCAKLRVALRDAGRGSRL